MHSLFRNSPSLPAILQWLFDLATWLIARSLQMPEPLLQSAGVFVFARVQAFEDSFGKSLCPIRVVRGALARPSGALTYSRFWLKPAFDLVMHLDVGQCTRYPGRRIAGRKRRHGHDHPGRRAAGPPHGRSVGGRDDRACKAKGLAPGIERARARALPKIAQPV